MKRIPGLGLLALLLGAWLSGCSSTSPARLCDSPLVPVNVLASPAHSSASRAGADHE
jgi:hypothetical protein